MTDSGFSPANPNRDSSAMIRPGFSNPHSTSSGSALTKDTVKESLSRQYNLPKPSPIFQTSKPIRPTRFFGPKSHGGYSPNIYSPKEMSPMSSLAFDFRDLNTSRDVADTPRKRLSLSSVSSVDSLHIRGLPSPLSISSNLNSPGSAMQEDGCRLRKVRAVKFKHGSVDQGLEQQLWQNVALWRSPTTSFSSVEFELVPFGSEQTSCSPADCESKQDCSSQSMTWPESFSFQPIIIEGCFVETPSPLDHSAMEAKFDQRALQDKDDNVPPVCGDSKLKMFRRFKSMPAGSKSGPRSRVVSSSKNPGKENSPLLSDATQQFTRRRVTVDSPSPLRPMVTGRSPAPVPSLIQRRRKSTCFYSPNLTSSPLATAFSSSSSSAFSSVPNPSSQLPSVSRTQFEIPEELRKSAEEKLRDAKSPANVSLTPEKSVVPGSISSLSAHTSALSRPASAAPFYRGKLPISEKDASPIFGRGNKRSLDVTNSSVVAETKRQKRNLTSENSTRRRMAFSSGDRKAKSADVAIMHSSPISSLKSRFRPISAPTLSFVDDDLPLSHSRLCSSNEPDSDDGDDVMSSSLEQSQCYADERLVEEIVSDNTRAHREASADEPMSLNDDIIAAPMGIAGLISAPLLASASVSEDRQKSAEAKPIKLPKPRELFRSPSAPPLVPSRKPLHAIRRDEHRNKDDTPQGGRRKSFFPTLYECSNYEEEEPVSTLNRSRSFNELDIIKAVELGCSDDNLIGDFSRVCSLETVRGKCQDLKYITHETVMSLIDKKQADDSNSFELIDCRYPYEYEGGHVKGAVSVWEEEVLYDKFLRGLTKDESERKPKVLIFYCEFSSERGPRMARALRSKDRCINIKYYPRLHYPEIYILRNGYKNFYNSPGTKEYCVPQSYCPMTHQDFSRELRMCRTKCKTWSGESKGGTMSRLKRF